MKKPRPIIAVGRHGQTIMNAYRPGKFFADAAARDSFLQRMGGAYDVRRTPITELGIYQAEEGARRFLELTGGPPDLIISSDADRAIITAAKQIQFFGQAIPLRVEPRLIERDFGHLEMLTDAEIKEQFPTLEEDLKQQGGFRFRPPGGESLEDLAIGRVAEALALIKEEALGHGNAKRILIDAHLAVGRVLRYLLQGLQPAALFHDSDMKFGNGDVFVFELRNKKWQPKA